MGIRRSTSQDPERGWERDQRIQKARVGLRERGTKGSPGAKMLSEGGTRRSRSHRVAENQTKESREDRDPD